MSCWEHGGVDAAISQSFYLLMFGRLRTDFVSHRYPKRNCDHIAREVWSQKDSVCRTGEDLVARTSPSHQRRLEYQTLHRLM